jgi:hypothetical protein
MPTTGWVMPGLATLVAGAATMALGALAFLLTLLVALVSRLPDGDRRGRRVLRFAAGPVVCLALGGAGVLVGLQAGGIDRTRTDDLAPLLPVAGVAAWVAVAVSLRRRSPGLPGRQ